MGAYSPFDPQYLAHNGHLIKSMGRTNKQTAKQLTRPPTAAAQVSFLDFILSRSQEQ